VLGLEVVDGGDFVVAIWFLRVVRVSRDACAD
jgi:hypothetical protein